jgi:dTDP-4-amino-4,6-dideoxygalactose transaminase
MRGAQDGGAQINEGKDEKGDWRGQQWDTDIVEAGYKFNMNNVAAAIGLSQIPHVQSILDAHKRNAHAYDVMFAGQSKILRPLQLSSTNPLWQWKFDSARWVYTIRTPHRDEKKLEIIERLNSFGIKAGLVHVPNDNYTCFASSKVDLPGVREFASTQFSIPCGWWLTDDDVRYIAEKVIDVVYERI